MKNSEEMSIRRLIIIDPTLKTRGGHEYLFTSELIKECKSRGMSVLTLVARDCEVDLVGELNAVPHFQNSINTPTRAQKEYWYYTAWVAINQRFDAELEDCNKFGISNSDLVLLHTATESNIFGLYNWVARRPEQKQPYVRAEFHYPNHLMPMDRRDRDIAIACIQRSLISWNALPPRKFNLHATNHNLASFLSKHASRAVSVLPLISRQSSAHHHRSVSPRLTFSFLGQARPGKGFDVIVQAILSDRGALDDFDFHLYIHSRVFINEEALKTVSRKNNVKVVDGILSNERFDKAVSDSDCVFVFYEPSEYKARVSSVFFDALKAGVPSIVTEGTTMADEMRRAGMPGVIADSYTPAALIRAIVSARSHWQQINDQARAQSYVYKRELTAENYLNIILS